LLGFIIRELQIIVQANNNLRPEISRLQDVCAVYSKPIEMTVNGVDPDNESIISLAGFGEPFEVQPSAILTPLSSSDMSSNVFTWTSTIDQIRERPYEAIIAAEEQNSVDNSIVGSLNTISGFSISIKAPAPTELVADTSLTETIDLNWTPYDVPLASEIQVWRREESLSENTVFCKFSPDWI